MRLTPVIAELGSLFGNAGHQLYLVGGSVRDALLDRLGDDLDFTTSARPDETERLLRKFTHSVWDIGKAFGTIGGQKRVDGVEFKIEITTFRADSYEPESRKPTVEFGDTIDGDLRRRDFTVNAMAIDVVTPTPKLVDPYGGLDDLADHLLRTPAPPEVSFSDDPLRMMRACRFTSQLMFAPTPDVRAAMTNMAARIEIVSAERVQVELTKLLLSDHPTPGLALMVATGLADYILPELPALRLERDEHNHHKDIYEHTLTVLERSVEFEKQRGHQPDLVGRLAALLHDIGKPATKRIEAGGKVSFHHHDVVGAKLAKRRLKALKYSNDVVDAVVQLVDQHLRFHGYGEAGWTDSAVRRYVRDAGDELERLHILTRSDCTTRNPRKAETLRRAYDELEFRIDELRAQEELDAIRPDLDGTQIMTALGIKPGPDVGRAYKWLLERRMEDGPLGETAATEALKAWWAGQTS
ncbi:MAG: CCA tRNA nucleotidyltransferase [Propionibacteriaceae bacterium]|nr:CCA tRNA nucleotidyltransferase [Propionibacteriaceae bacterium]